jgi:glutamate-1-semialdehyde aminotransferase
VARAQLTASRVDHEIKKRAEQCIAHGALTNSKRAQSFVNGVYPTHLIAGKGVHVTDTRNYQYTDFICGLGTNLLGYGQTIVVDAVVKAAKQGPTLSLSTPKEIELAEKIKEIMPFIERVKFLKTGSEGCSAAVRIARAYKQAKRGGSKTFGSFKVLSENYHGWHDEFVSLTPPANGVPRFDSIETLTEDYSDECLSRADAVIIEPISLDLSPARIEWLRKLKSDCVRLDVVLIFDETITALRFPKYSVANYYSIQPDLIVFGKALGNGFPISCVGGRAALMEQDYFVSSTFAGETCAIAAGLACITALQRTYDLQHLWNCGRRFIEKFNAEAFGVQIQGYNTRGILAGDDLPKALFMQESVRAGLLFGPSWFFAFPHIELEDQVLSVVKDVSMKLRNGVKLEGDLPKRPIAQQIREKKAA